MGAIPLCSLFPYINEGEENEFVWNSKWVESKKRIELKSSSFSYQMNKVPFIWDYFGIEIDMAFIGGLIGVAYKDDNSLQPVFGYGVVYINTRENKQTTITAATTATTANSINTTTTTTTKKKIPFY